MKRVRLLIDVHSYPKGAFNNSEIAVLDNVPGTWYGRLLFDLLVRDGLSAAYFYGSDVNDIVIEARARGIPAVLLEYQEELTIDQINRLILPWIYYMLR